MAYITKNDILNGVTIIADFWRRIIDALDGTSATDIKIKGKLELDKDKLTIDGTPVNTTAEELNGLAARTPGISEANKPVVLGANKEVDYMKATQLEVDELILQTPGLGDTAGKLYCYHNFI